MRSRGARGQDLLAGAGFGEAGGADRDDVGRRRLAVAGGDLLLGVTRLDVIVNQPSRDAAARNRRDVPALARPLQRHGVVERHAGGPVVEREHLRADARLRDAVDVEVFARRHLVGQVAGHGLADVAGQLAALDQLLFLLLVLDLLAVPLALAGRDLRHRLFQLLARLALLLVARRQRRDLLVAVGLVLLELRDPRLRLAKLPVTLRLLLQQGVFRFALLLVAAGQRGDLLVLLGLVLLGLRVLR